MKRLGNWIDLGRVASWHLWAVASVLPCRRRKQRGRISVATGPGARLFSEIRNNDNRHPARASIAKSQGE
jgi:hypothetical protein